MEIDPKLEAERKYKEFISELPEDVRYVADGEAIANSFATEVHAEYADDLERWTVALNTAIDWADAMAGALNAAVKKNY
jgi:hypothetical protein|tara:strand:+ start:85 stop:321 length:237 start_codon:yes stop_codon:yes gene_type:complete